jgi:signal transduction histidine kinase
MKKISFLLALIFGFLIVLASFYGYFLLQKRADLPLKIKKAFERGQVVQIDGIEIEQRADLEFILSRKSEGETVSVWLKTDEGTTRIQEKLIAFYAQTPFPLINLAIGLFLMLIAFVVLILRREEIRARLFFWGGLVFSFAMIINGGFYCLRNTWVSYIPGILFYIFYPLAAALLLHFSSTFLWTRIKGGAALIYLPALLYGMVWNFFFLSSAIKSSLEIFRQYQNVVFYFRILVVVYLLVSFLILFLSIRKARLEEEKAQIKWILYGLFMGTGPFIFLYQLPRVLLRRPLVTEEITNVFFIFIPFAFAFSIVRFKLMNIELVINKSLVYSILTIFTVSVYLLSIQILQKLFTNLFPINSATVTVIGVLAAAVAFHPARKKIQEFVDKSFFRLSYDYRRSIQRFNELTHKIVRQDQLVDLFFARIADIIPLENLGIKVFSSVPGRKVVLFERGRLEGVEGLSPMVLESNRILTRRKSVSTELGVDFGDENLFEGNPLEMIIPLPFRTGLLSGFLTLGKKKSGSKYSGEDMELLLTMAEILSLNMERIHLQEEVIYERAQKEKLDELNRLKTEFISNVSHEVRTPMSSIHGLSEILQQGKVKGKKKQDELLSLMAGECDRLSRFLHNILDHARIEQGAKVYSFRKSDICSVLRDLLKLNAERLKSLGFYVEQQIPENALWLDIDTDSVKQALTNLLDNAIKYSPDKREISVRLMEKSRHIEIHLSDKGIGIPESEQRKIFEGFYREVGARELDPRGVGIGLKIVKHIMEAHGGQVLVKSQVNKGSTFILVFSKP